MREIKFREWNGKQVIYQSNTCSFNIGGPHGNESLAWLGFDLLGSDDIGELMQYIGRKDKNGKEIYEGDIVKGFGGITESGEGIGVVVWCENNELSCGSGSIPGFCIEGFDGIDSDFDEVEIIGNIYENPELLEK